MAFYDFNLWRSMLELKERPDLVSKFNNVNVQVIPVCIYILKKYNFIFIVINSISSVLRK